MITFLKGQNQVLKTLAQIIQCIDVLFEIEKSTLISLNESLSTAQFFSSHKHMGKKISKLVILSIYNCVLINRTLFHQQKPQIEASNN